MPRLFPGEWRPSRRAATGCSLSGGCPTRRSRVGTSRHKQRRASYSDEATEMIEPKRIIADCRLYSASTQCCSFRCRTSPSRLLLYAISASERGYKIKVEREYSYDKAVYVYEYAHSEIYPRPTPVYVVNWLPSEYRPVATRVYVVNGLPSNERPPAENVYVVNDMATSEMHPPPENVYVVNPEALPISCKCSCRGYAICPRCGSILRRRTPVGYDCNRCRCSWRFTDLRE